MCICSIQQRPAGYSQGEAGKESEKPQSKIWTLVSTPVSSWNPLNQFLFAKLIEKGKKFCSRLRSRARLAGGEVGYYTLGECLSQKETGICQIAAKIPSVPQLTVCSLTRGDATLLRTWPPRRSCPAQQQEATGQQTEAVRALGHIWVGERSCSDSCRRHAKVQPLARPGTRDPDERFNHQSNLAVSLTLLALESQ